MKTKNIEDSLENIEIFYEWWLEALNEQKYAHADIVRKRLLEPEIESCIKLYDESPESEMLIKEYKKILERTSNNTSIFEDNGYIKNIYINNISIQMNIFESKIEQLIEYCTDKIKILEKLEEYEYIPNIIVLHLDLSSAYRKFIMSKSTENEEKTFSDMRSAYNGTLKKIRYHNDLFDSRNPQEENEETDEYAEF